MSNQEIVKILKVETQGSERTVKSLKTEISSLRDALLNVERGSEQYQDIVKQLRQDQDDLSHAMSIGKEQAEGLEGSYNYLVRTMKELKTEWKATTDEVRRNELGQQIDVINSKLKDMDSSIGNYQRNVGNYADGFSQAMKEMKDSTEVTRTKLESVQKIASGLASGYAAVQGAMALFGVENEKLAQTFVKLQAAIALAQGIGGMKDLIEGLGMAKVAFKGAQVGATAFMGTMSTMKAVLVGTGIGAFVVGLGMLIEYLMKVAKEGKEATNSLEKLNDEIEKSSIRSKWGNARADTKAMKDYIKAVAEANGDIEKLRKAEEDYQKTLKDNVENATKNKYEAAKKQLEQAREAYASEKERANSDIDYENKMTKEELKTLFNKVMELEAQVAEAEKDVYDLEIKGIQETIKAKEEQIKKDDEAQEEAQKKKEAQQQKDAENERQKAVKAEEDKQKAIKAVIDKYNSSSKSTNAEQGYKEQETELKYDAMEADTPVGAVQLEIDKMNELRDIRLEAHNERLAQIDEVLSSKLLEAETIKEYETEKANLIRENAIEEQKYLIENAELSKKLSKAKEDEEKKAENIKKLQYQSSLKVAKDTFDAVGKLAKEGSVTQKALAIAGTTIDTYQSATAAYKAMAGIPTVGPALAVIAASNAIASGLANVKQIIGIDAENGENGVKGMSGVGVTPSFNASEAMPVEYTRNLLTNSEIDAFNSPTKVYVLESDITETQNKVEVTENNATF